jgi:hypothetical protein
MKQKIIHSFWLLLLVVAENEFAGQMAPGRSYYDSLLQQSVGTKNDDGVPRSLILGREYYRALLDRLAERHWVVPISFFGNVTYRGFGCDGTCQTSLANSLFGAESVRLRDIFLLARLCDDNKICSHQEQQATKIRPAGSPLEFGRYANDIAVTLLAPMKIGLTAEQHELGANFSAAYRCKLFGSEDVIGVFGLNIPVKSRTHIVDLDLSEGKLFIQGFNIPNAPNSNPLTQFFAEFSSIEDFFKRAVLDPKGIVWEKQQKKVGIGDIALFGLIDIGGMIHHVDGLQCGGSVIFPTGNQAKGSSLWEIELGNGGGFQFEGFITTILNSSCRYFNPCLKLVGQVSASHYATNRTPRVRKFAGPRQRMSLIENLDLIVSVETISKYYVSPFEEYDSTVSAFADKAVRTCVKSGPKVMVGVGNYFYDLFNANFRLGAFYDFTYKGQDKSEAVCDSVVKIKNDLCLCTTSQAHRFGWNLTYKFESLVEVNIGSEHILAGKNIPKTHEAFASVVLVF